MLLAGAIHEFLVAGRAGGWSAATVHQYGWHLERWRAWLAERAVVDLEGISRSLLREYGASLADQYEPATRRVAAIALRSLLNWLAEEEEIAEAKRLASAVKPPKVPPRVQRTMELTEVEAMLRACDAPYGAGMTPAQGDATRSRNAAIVAVLFDCLLRASELCRLDVQHVYLERRRLEVRGKGGGEALVRFSAATGEYLAAWLAVREGYAAAGETALFTAITGNQPGQRLTTNGLRIVVRKLGERAGVENVSPHAFRRGGAVQAVENGAPDRMLQLHARWAKTDMIETYTRALRADERFDDYSPMRSLNGHRLPLEQ